MSCRRSFLTLNQALNVLGIIPEQVPWIKYDPNMKPKYKIIRTVKHDGTYTFTHNLFFDALENLLNMNSYYTKDGLPEMGTFPVYTVGKIKHSAVFGRVDLPVGNYQGMRERIRIPVSVEWRKLDH